MATTNDITGDSIVSKPTSELYLKNWDSIFGWISVTDKLPKPSEIVQVKTDRGDIHEAYLCDCCKSEWRDPISGSSLWINVTHWRTL